MQNQFNISLAIVFLVFSILCLRGTLIVKHLLDFKTRAGIINSFEALFFFSFFANNGIVCSMQTSFYGFIFFLNKYFFSKHSTHHLDIKQHEGESYEILPLGCDGLNNDAVNFSKRFNPKIEI